MSDETTASPENSPDPSAGNAPRARRISTPRPKKAAKKSGTVKPTAADVVRRLVSHFHPLRSATTAAGGANAATQNPDFDLWSSGKDGVTNPATPADTKNRDDIKNF
jgi:hypothetical protein